MGQQTTFEPWIGETICEALSEGHSLLSICEAMGIPHATARGWEEQFPEHGAQCKRARELGCHYLAEQCLTIADDASRDWEPVKDDSGAVVGIKVDGEHVQRSRLRIDTRMRLIGKWLPKVYGDRTTLAGDPDAPLAQQLTDDQLAARIAALQAKVNAPG